MNLVFVYGTLRDAGILEQVLGEHHTKRLWPATIRGAIEEHQRIDGESYPTLIPEHGASLKGFVVGVSQTEIRKLDAWEAKYKRVQVQTDFGPAWTYVLNDE